MRIYLAGPLFCESEREYNVRLAEALRSSGHTVVLPQDCPLPFDSGKMNDASYAREAAKTVFSKDLEMLESCDALVINLDGRVPDEGACIELGYAYARNKKVFGIKTDIRVSEYGIDNMMIAGMLEGRIAGNISELLQMLT